MTIRVHVACDDAAYRSAIADYLGAEREIEIVGVSGNDQLGAAAVELLSPDVVVLRASAGHDAGRQLRTYRNARPRALIAFCSGEQAEQCRRAGADAVVLEQDPARKLRAAVKAAARRRRSADYDALLNS